MEYTLIHKNVSYDLPKYTKSIRNDVARINSDNASKGLSDDEKSKRMYQFIRKVVGEDAAMKIFETDDLEEIDLQEIAICYIRICASYEKVLAEARSEAEHPRISPEDRAFVSDFLKNAGNVKNIETFIDNNKSRFNNV